MSSDSSDLDGPVGHRPPRFSTESLYPGRGQSLSGISFRSFVLGTVLGLSVLASIQLLFYCSPFWRPTVLFAALALFHFLEFFSTAKADPPRARVSAFILTSNGRAYFAAHGISFTEFLLRRLFTSDYWPEFLTYTGYLSEYRRKILIYQPYAAVAGIVLMIMGQSVRTAAMVEAGQSFNHLVQYKKRDNHKLITSGVYSRFRHPAYFGFFWYVVGTQLLLGNPVCLFLLPAVLWKFFAARITQEEKFLVSFFGQAYIEYCKRTNIFIPFLH